MEGKASKREECAKIMPQGSLTRAIGQTKYSTKDTHIDDNEASPGSLPPIMGVMGNNKMQQTYKYQPLDKKNGTKRKKKLKPFENKHVYNVPSYSQGANISKNYVGGGILSQQSTTQNKSSNHFNFASQAKSGHLHGPCATTGRQSHIQVRYKKK